MIREQTLRGSLVHLAAIAIVIAAQAAHAAEDWTPAKTLAVGGACRAVPLDAAAITTNPGAIISPTGGGNVSVGFQRFDPTRSNVFHFSAMETRNLWAAGISQSFEWSKPPFIPEEDLSWYDDETVDELEHKRNIYRFALAVAHGFFLRQFNVGAALRVYRVEDDLVENRSPVSVDVGLDWWISPNVAIAVAGGNLVPTKLDEEPTTLAAGFGTILGGGLLWLDLDGVIDFSSSDKPLIDMRAGGQLTILRQFNLRAGFASDYMFRDQYVSWGLGWTVTGFSASYSMRIELGDMDRRLNDNVSEGANRLLHAWLITVGF